MATDSEPDAWVRRRSASGPRFPPAGAAALELASAASPLRRFGAARRPVPAVEETQRLDEDEPEAEDEHGGEGDDEGGEEPEDDAMTQDILADTPESPESPETPATPPVPEHADAAGASPPPPLEVALLMSPPRTAIPLPRVAPQMAQAQRQAMAVTEQAAVAAMPIPVPAPAAVAANMSPAEASAVSGEDDDYRSETSSEVSSSRGSRPKKNITASCADHRDLSARLRRAVNPNAETIGFDDSLIGADVVLCVRRRKKNLLRRKRIPRHSDSDEDDDEAMTQDCVEDDKPEIQRFHAHRFMLAASSAPFKAMLTGRMRESIEREVEIQGIDAPIVEKMLLFIYTGGGCHATFRVPDCKSIIDEQIRGGAEVVLDLDNVVGLVIASEMYELDALREMCKGFVLNHAHEVFRDPQIVQVPEKILLEVRYWYSARQYFPLAYGRKCCVAHTARRAADS